jgi:hypothetical protein
MTNRTTRPKTRTRTRKDEGEDGNDEDDNMTNGINFEPKKVDADSHKVRAYKIDGPGLYTFLLWADAIMGVPGQGPVNDVLYLALKNAAPDAYKRFEEGK